MMNNRGVYLPVEKGVYLPVEKGVYLPVEKSVYLPIEKGVYLPVEKSKYCCSPAETFRLHGLLNELTLLGSNILINKNKGTTLNRFK